MISEVVNALVLTYFATEYNIETTKTTRTVSSSSGYNSTNRNQREEGRGGGKVLSFLQIIFRMTIEKKQNLVILLLFIVVNISDRLVVVSDILHVALSKFFHIPKILLVAFLYILVLYIDVKSIITRKQEDDSQTTPILFTNKEFFKLVGIAFIKVIPLYPLLAIIISFLLFFFVIVCEFFGIPDSMLNNPIYYCTLYGPFSFIYYDVKYHIIITHNKKKTTILPT